jgi:hypothetical protein
MMVAHGEATDNGTHASVVYREKDSRFIFESLAKSRKKMIRRLPMPPINTGRTHRSTSNLQRHL